MGPRRHRTATGCRHAGLLSGHARPSPRRTGHASARRALPTVGSVCHPGTCVRLQGFGGTIWECCHSCDFHVRPGQERQPSQRHQTVGPAGYGWSGVWTAAGTVATARDQCNSSRQTGPGGLPASPTLCSQGPYLVPEPHRPCRPAQPGKPGGLLPAGSRPWTHWRSSLHPVLRPRGGEGAEGGLWAIEDEAHPGFLSPHPQPPGAALRAPGPGSTRAWTLGPGLHIWGPQEPPDAGSPYPMGLPCRAVLRFLCPTPWTS